MLWHHLLGIVFPLKHQLPFCSYILDSLQYWILLYQYVYIHLQLLSQVYSMYWKELLICELLLKYHLLLRIIKNILWINPSNLCVYLENQVTIQNLVPDLLNLFQEIQSEGSSTLFCQIIYFQGLFNFYLSLWRQFRLILKLHFL